MKKKTSLLRSTLLIVIVAVVCASYFFSALTSANTRQQRQLELNQAVTASINNYLRSAEQAAKANLLFAALDHCIGRINPNSNHVAWGFSGVTNINEFIKKIPFGGSNSNNNHQNFNDSWIEVIINGDNMAPGGDGNEPPPEKDDNLIWCSESSGNNNLIPALAAAIGLQPIDILCHYSDNSKYGIAARGERISGVYHRHEYGCNDFGTPRERHIVRTPDGFSRRYLSELYMWYSTQNPYARLITNSSQTLIDAWSESNSSMTAGEKYYYFLMNFYATCGQNEVSQAYANDFLSGRVYTVKKMEIQGDPSQAVAVNKNVRTFRDQPTTQRGGRFSLLTGPVTSSDMSCDVLINRINNAAAALATDINERIINEFHIPFCLGEFDQQRTNQSNLLQGYRHVAQSSRIYLDHVNEAIQALENDGDIEAPISRANDIAEAFAGSTPQTFHSDYASYIELLNTARTNQSTGMNNINTTLNNLLENPTSETLRASLNSQKATFEDDTNRIVDAREDMNIRVTANNARTNRTSPGSGSSHIFNYNSSDFSNFDCHAVEDYNPTLDLSGVQTGPTDPSLAINRDPSCFDGGGSLGWILCPLLDGIGRAVEFFYDRVIQPFLQVNVGLFNSPGDPVFRAWQIFQSIANIVFVILLLFVIFSQLTGVGIDNYGIKKILPKLIIAAILINLSYIICQIAIDVSNILGYGLRAFFDSISSGIPIASSSGGSGTGATVISIIMIVLLGAIGIAMIISNGLAILFPLILALIGALIGIFFTFLLLSVRQAGIVLLVVVAPVAFVCYILPNTKVLFDKWLKILKGLLLFFPLCGFIIGAGEMASRILLSTAPENFFMALTAMLMGIVPFFFLPTLLKAAFAAMGNIGARISGFGSNLGRGLNNNIRNSDAYRHSRASLAAGKAGGLRERIASRNSFTQRSMARNRAEHLKNQRENASAGILMGSGFTAAQDKLTADVERENLDNYIAMEMANTNKGEDTTALNSRYRSAIGSGNVMQARAIAEIAGRRKDTAARFTKDLRSDLNGGLYNSANGQSVLAGVTKQITTGGASGTYRSADGLAFEYSSQYNRGETALTDYNAWTTQVVDTTTGETNTSRAIEHHMTTGQELYGQSKGVLEELNSGITTGALRPEDAAYLSALAARGQAEATQTGVYDQTKEIAISQLQDGGITTIEQANELRDRNVRSSQGDAYARLDDASLIRISRDDPSQANKEMANEERNRRIP
jgi:type II secretory pathway pseudopilin PulG